MTRTVLTFDGIGYRFGTAVRAGRTPRGLFVRFDDRTLFTFVDRRTLGVWWRLAPDAENKNWKGPTS